MWFHPFPRTKFKGTQVLGSLCWRTTVSSYQLSKGASTPKAVKYAGSVPYTSGAQNCYDGQWVTDGVCFSFCSLALSLTRTEISFAKRPVYTALRQSYRRGHHPVTPPIFALFSLASHTKLASWLHPNIDCITRVSQYGVGESTGGLWHSTEKYTVGTKPKTTSSVSFPDHSLFHRSQRSFSQHSVACVTEIHVMRTLRANQLQECMHICVQMNVKFAFPVKIIFITSCQLW